jgi:hypothetical protein
VFRQHWLGESIRWRWLRRLLQKLVLGPVLNLRFEALS